MSMGALFSATSCTAHSCPEPFVIVARIASVNGCPVTASGATSTFCTSPSSLNAATAGATEQVDARQAGDAVLVGDGGRGRGGGG